MSGPADDIVGLYQRHAKAWDRRRGRSVFERPWLDRFAALVGAGGHVLDLGCGSGEPIAADFVAHGFHITGVDSSPGLIALCRARFPDQQWQEADMRSLTLEKMFDAIIAWDSFFHLDFEDQRQMFPRFAAHMRPGAPLMFTSGPRHGEALGEFEGDILFHASLAPEEYRALLGANGFEVVAFIPEDPTCGGHSIWLARKCG